MLELMESLGEPVGGRALTVAQRQCAQGVEVFSRMRKIQDTQRVWAMVINEALNLLGPIHDCGRFFRLGQPTSVGFDQRQPLKGFVIGQAREVG